MDLRSAALHNVSRFVAEPGLECGPDTQPSSVSVRLSLSSRGVNDTTPSFPLRDASLPTSTLKCCHVCKCHRAPSENVFIYPQGSQLDNFCQNFLKRSLSLSKPPTLAAFFASHPDSYFYFILTGAGIIIVLPISDHIALKCFCKHVFKHPVTCHNDLHLTGEEESDSLQ